MARVALTVTNLGSAGTALPAPTLGQVDGHMFANDGRTIVEIQNTGAGAHVVTFPTPAEYAGYAVEDLAVSIPAGATRYISKLNSQAFNRPAGGTDPGMAYINYDATPAELSVRVFRG